MAELKNKVKHALAIAAGTALGSVVVFGTVWFGVTIYIRTTRHQRTLKEASASI